MSLLSRKLIHCYEQADIDTLSDMAYETWVDHPDVLLDAMYMWFQFTVHDRGEDYVRWAVNNITADVGTMDVDEPESRVVFCDMLYAMFDQSFTRAMAAWQPVRDAGNWPVACEVLSLMLAYVGHFIGAPRGMENPA